MGMFDYFVVESTVLDELKLPTSPRSDPVFQTKSLTNTLATFVLKEKELYMWHREYEQTDEVAWEMKTGFKIMKKKLISEEDIFVPYTGTINIYCEGDDLVLVFVKGIFQEYVWYSDLTDIVKSIIY